MRPMQNGINANVHAARIKPTIILTDVQAGKQDLTFIADPAGPFFFGAGDRPPCPDAATVDTTPDDA